MFVTMISWPNAMWKIIQTIFLNQYPNSQRIQDTLNDQLCRTLKLNTLNKDDSENLFFKRGFWRVLRPQIDISHAMLH